MVKWLFMVFDDFIEGLLLNGVVNAVVFKSSDITNYVVKGRL